MSGRIPSRSTALPRTTRAGVAKPVVYEHFGGKEGLYAVVFDREMQTLVLIASGKRLADIAEALTLSPKTVSVYRSRVLDKLSMANNAELTVYAIKNGLVGS